MAQAVPRDFTGNHPKAEIGNQEKASISSI
jgi:hypothetical protein